MAKRVTTIPASINRFNAMPIASTKKKRVAGYARVSTDSDEQATSYEAQMEYYTDYISKRADWEFAGMYSDEGITATNTRRREGFKQMIEDALAGKIDLIITKSVSRFARNTVDSLTTVRQLKEKGVEIYFEKENIWTLDAKGELLITIMSSLAQEESRSISENVTWGKRKQFADGKTSVSFSTFLGYDKGPNGEFVINEEQAKVVRYIYKRYLEGVSSVVIAKNLTEMGIKTPAGKTKWQTSTVMSILRNEKYKGDALIQKYYTKDFLTHKMCQNKGEVQQYYVEGHHEGIVTPEQFDLVQAEMLRRHKMDKYSGSGVFSSIIICGECGSWFGAKVWHSNDKYRRVVYQCNGKYGRPNKNIPGNGCKTPHLMEDDFKRGFVQAVNELISEKEEMIKNAKDMMKMVCDTKELDKAQAGRIEELNIITQQIEKAIAENSRVALDQAEYQERYNGLVKRYETVKAEYDETAGEVEQKNIKREMFKGFIKTLEDTGEVVHEFDDGLFRLIVEKVVVHARTDVRYVFKNGVEIGVDIK